MVIGARSRIVLFAIGVAAVIGVLATLLGLVAPLDTVRAEATDTRDGGPAIATITSETHPDQDTWYRGARVSMAWSASGADVTGYSFVLDDTADTTPDTTSEGGATATVYGSVTDGTSYFHVRAIDAAGVWGPARHFRIRVDATDPRLPVVSSATHGSQGAWSAVRSPEFSWSATDATSEIAGYSYKLDQTADTAPPTTSSGPTSHTTFSGTADGVWYFHVRAVDAAGNWGPTQHQLIRIDATTPQRPTITSSTHPSPGTSYALNDPSFAWNASDASSGVAGYSYALDRKATSEPDTSSEGRAKSRTYRDIAVGRWYFHVRAVDGAGTWGPTQHFAIQIVAATSIPPTGGTTSGTTGSGTTGYGATGATATDSGPTAAMPSAAADYSLLSRFPGAVFPVVGRYWYADWWHAPRAGGRLHEGSDIFAAYGTPIVAVQSGVLSNVSTTGIGGNNLRLSNDQGDYFYYAHLSQFAPTTVIGARVEAGQTIGYVGTSGDAQGTDPHLHFEIHPQSGVAVDPYEYLEAWRAAGSELGAATRIDGQAPAFDPALEPVTVTPVATAPTSDPALVAALDRVAAGLQTIDGSLVDTPGDTGAAETTSAELVLTVLSGIGAIALKRLKMAAVLM